MKKTAKMKKTLMAVALAFSVGAWAADTARVTAPGGATTGYASLQAALNACTGGETVTMLTDETVTGSLTIPVSVTLDLDGHLVKNTSGDFLNFANGVTLWICGGGTLQGGGVVFQFQSASSATVNVTNCTVKGWVGTYGSSNTSSINAYADSSFELTFMGSGWASVGFNVYGGRFSIATGWWQGRDQPGTVLNLQGGCFNKDPSAASTRILAQGYTVVSTGDPAYPYGVAESSSIVARVTTSGGISTDYDSLRTALAACTEGGETVTMLADELFSADKITITTNIVLDLSGHTISKGSGDFLNFADGVAVTIKNGTIRGATGASSCLALGVSGTVTVTNCQVVGFAMVYGTGATLDCLSDTRASLRYLASGHGFTVFNILGGNYSVSDGIWHETGRPGTQIKARAGYFSFDPSSAVDSGCHAVRVNEVVDGVTYSHRVKVKEANDPCAIVTKPGESPRDFNSIQSALDACTGGETVTVNATPSLKGVVLTIPASVTLDLGNYFTECKYLSPAADVHLVLTNGTIQASDSAIHTGSGNAATVVDVRNCAIKGFNMTYGKGTVNLYEGTVIDLMQFVSAYASAHVNVYGGRIRYTRERDSGHPTEGTTVSVYGGDFATVPFNTFEGSRLNLAEGYRAVYTRTTASGITCFYQVGPSSGYSPVAVVEPGIYCLTFADTMASILPSRYITLLTDLGQTTQITNDVVVNLGGHVIAPSNGVVNVLDVFAGHTATISNGTLRVTGGASCAVARDNATVTLGQGLTLKGTGDVGGNGCSTWIPGNSAQVIMDGATVETKYLHSISTATGALQVRGASVVQTPTFKAGAQNTAYAEGGYWSMDPGAYVTNNFVKLYRANASPCKWQVKPWAAICADGWSFDFADEVPTVTGTCVAPSGPITVSLVGAVPTRKTLLADLSGLVLNSGTYADLSFVKDVALPGAVQVSYENGRLYAWEAKGTLIVFQ